MHKIWLRAIARTAGLVAMASMACLPAGAAARQDFDDEVHDASRRYAERAQQPDMKQAALEGHISRANEMLLQFVPDERKTAADWFVVGNMLYRADMAASDRAMKHAEALLPREPAILLERGMAEHRAHHCAVALGYYDRFHASRDGKDHFVSWAYSTQCHLMLGEVDKALADWRHAGFARHHVGIEAAMYDVFSTRNMDREREALVAAVSRSNPDALCELMTLDTHWEIDWWNSKERTDYLEQDTRLARDLLAGDAKALADFELCHDDAVLPAEEVVKHVIAAGYWGAQPTLPTSPRLSYLIVNALTSTKTATPKAVLAAWGDALERRLAAAPTDRATLEVLGFLYVNVDDQAHLKAIDLQGWKRLHLLPFAESYVMGRLAAHEPADEALMDGFAEFPDSAAIAYLRLREAPKGLARSRAFTDFVAANFASAASPFPRDMRLSEAMGLLAEEDDKGFRPDN